MNRRQRRTLPEIWAGILEVCARSGRSQTWIRRSLGLKTEMIRGALDFLVSAGLIRITTSGNTANTTYLTTQKGEEALTQYYLLFTKYFRPQNNNVER